MKIVRPTLVLNKTICLRNIEIMQQKAKRHNLRFRPHFKTHQSIEIGRWYRNMGVTQITVSSVTMAKYFASDGWDDITIAVPFNFYEIDDLNELAAKINITILIDNIELLDLVKDKLTSRVDVFIKISTGYYRAGISSNSISTIEELLKGISLADKLNFKGFLSHSGHTYLARSKNEIQNIHFDAIVKMGRLKKHFIQDYPNIEISIGDTPSCTTSENFQGIDEIRPGNFIFFDLSQHKIGVCSFDDIAVRLHCPVISKNPGRNEVIVYGGAIHLSKDHILNIAGKPSYGRIIIKKNNEDILLGSGSYVCRVSQEHGVLKLSSFEYSQINIGDIIQIVPVHSCLTANLMKKYITKKGNEISMMGC